MRLTVLCAGRHAYASSAPLGVQLHATWRQARRTHAGLVDHDISTAAPLHAADVLAMLAAAPTLHVHGYVACPYSRNAGQWVADTHAYTHT